MKKKNKPKKVNPLREAKRQRREALKKKTTIGVTSRNAMQSGKALKARTQQLAKQKTTYLYTQEFDTQLNKYRQRVLNKFDEKYDIKDFKDIDSSYSLDMNYIKNEIIRPYRESKMDDLVSRLESMDATELYVRHITLSDGDKADINAGWDFYMEIETVAGDMYLDSQGNIYTKKDEENRLIDVWTRPLTSEEIGMINDLKNQENK